MQFTSNMSKLEDLDFADDIALISTKFKTIADRTTIVKAEDDETGLNINVGRAKGMRINTKIYTQIRIDRHQMEDISTPFLFTLQKMRYILDNISTNFSYQSMVVTKPQI